MTRLNTKSKTRLMTPKCCIFIVLALVSFSGCYTFEYDPGSQQTQEDMADMADTADAMEDNKPVVTITMPSPNAQVQNAVRLVAVAAAHDQTVLTDGIVWVHNGTAIQTGGNVTHTFTPGLQTVIARVTDIKGISGEAEVSFNVTN